jgi:hypothetical protein
MNAIAVGIRHCLTHAIHEGLELVDELLHDSYTFQLPSDFRSGARKTLYPMVLPLLHTLLRAGA